MATPKRDCKACGNIRGRFTPMLFGDPLCVRCVAWAMRNLLREPVLERLGFYPSQEPTVVVNATPLHPEVNVPDPRYGGGLCGWQNSVGA